VRQLLTFSKGGAPILRPTNQLGALIRESAEFSAHGTSVRLELGLAPELHTVAIDSGQFSRVIQNLIINAIQASPAGGTVRIEVENIAPTTPDAPPAVSIRVIDRGHGIPEDLLERIFEPYVTTRAEGSGLGLATVRSIVQRHGGKIYVESRPGEGTTFHLTLPASPEPPKEDASIPLSSEHQSGGSRVLVMDDEPMIRNLARTVLEDRGHRVTVAASGEQAIAACEQALADQGGFDVVVLDLTIVGGMGGKEAMQHIRRLLPGAGAIVSSGYSQEPVMASHDRHGFDMVLQKPYTPDELLEAVTNVRRAR
jgi:CheY-like chemotaxis protein